LHGFGTAPDVMAAAAVASNVVVTAAYVGAAWYTRDAVARWFVAMVEHQHHAGDHIRDALARRWIISALVLFLGMATAHLYEVIFAHFEVSQAVIRTLAIVVGLVLVETLFD